MVAYSIGSYCAQIPPGDRKSGMPDSVETPAPARTTHGWWSRIRSARAAADTRPVSSPVVGQFHFDPESYPETIRREIPLYEALEGRIAEATAGVDATRILDLGGGTGETARRVLAVHPNA